MRSILGSELHIKRWSQRNGSINSLPSIFFNMTRKILSRSLICRQQSGYCSWMMEKDPSISSTVYWPSWGVLSKLHLPLLAFIWLSSDHNSVCFGWRPYQIFLQSTLEILLECPSDIKCIQTLVFPFQMFVLPYRGRPTITEVFACMLHLGLLLI